MSNVVSSTSATPKGPQQGAGKGPKPKKGGKPKGNTMPKRINKSNIDHSAAHFVLFVKKTFSLQQNYTIN